MANSVTFPRPQAAPVVSTSQVAVQPNRALESRLDRMMFASLGNRPALLVGLE